MYNEKLYNSVYLTHMTSQVINEHVVHTTISLNCSRKKKVTRVIVNKLPEKWNGKIFSVLPMLILLVFEE